VSQALLRALKLLETVDFYGPLTITELARHLEVDKATASRMVASCEPDGWLVRDSQGVRIGARAAMLGQDAVAGQAVRTAQPLVHAVCGVTGVLTQAVGLVGAFGVVLASAWTSGAQVRLGLTTRFPLWLSASGKVIASQLDGTQLDKLVPDPFTSREEVLERVAPASFMAAFVASLGLSEAVLAGELAGEPAGATAARDRRELDAQLEVIRRDGVFLDHGELLQQTACIGVPWPRPGMPAALVCIATESTVAADGALIERALRAAAMPGATRESIVAAAAG
jgi:DNA-binding IclR family transcriptional regulator